MPMHLVYMYVVYILSLLRGIIKSISLYLESNGESSILYQCVKELRATQLNSSFTAPASPTSCSHQLSRH